MYLHEDAMMESQAHCQYGEYLLWEDSLSGVKPDYCKAILEFEKAIKYDIDFRANPVLFQNYKTALSRHSMLLFNSYVNDKQNKINGFVNKEAVLACDTCIGEQQLDRCIDELKLLVSLEQTESEISLIDTLALVLLGECYYYKDEYEKATDYYEKSGIAPERLVELNGPESARIFLDSYIKQGKEEEQDISLLETLIESYRNDYNVYRQWFRDEPDDKESTGSWANLAHTVMIHYMGQEEYEKALDFWFKIKNNFSFNYMLLMDQALCHIFLGDFSAISDLAFAFDMMNRNGQINDYLLSEDFSDGDSDPFIIIKRSFFDLAAYSCYVQENFTAAKDYYLSLNQKDPLNILMQAICYKKMAEKEHNPQMKTNFEHKADMSFRDVIIKEDSIGKLKNTPYAYDFLGEYDKAVATLEHILQTELPLYAFNEEDSLYCHDLHFKAAEVYARVGQTKKAEYHLAKSLEYSHNPMLLAYILKAPLLDSIQDFAYGEVNRYKKSLGLSESLIRKDTIISDIPFTRNNDYTRTVSCMINGEPIDGMLFDPGADKVQLTRAKAEEIGITSDDVIGMVATKNANGTTVKKQLVSLKKVEVGNIVLENVQAYIDENNKAPLLLGCTVLNNLAVEMPSPVNKGMIRLTYIKESVEIPEKQAKHSDKIWNK